MKMYLIQFPCAVKLYLIQICLFSASGLPPLKTTSKQSLLLPQMASGQQALWTLTPSLAMSLLTWVMVR